MSLVGQHQNRGKDLKLIGHETRSVFYKDSREEKKSGPVVQDTLLGIEAIDQKSAPSSDQRTEIKNKKKLSLSFLLSKSFH